MVLAIVLLAILFLIGFINTLFYIPPNKLFVLIQSYFLKTLFSQEKNHKEVPRNSSTSTTSSSDSGTVVTSDKNHGHGKMELERVFATFDKNGDGFITKQELGESLKNIGLFSDEIEVDSMVAKLDVNGDGLIDIDEFCELYDSIMGKKKKREKKLGEEQEEDEDDDDVDDEEEVMKEAFDVFDGDKDGLISVEELGIVLKSLGLKQGMKVEECKEMIRKVDMDGDGMVSFDEFKLMMKSGTNLIQVIS
ncbi:calmodulin-like protein 7 [Papaver somniferum]|uniref:calmodulin-like protein 7 n=1 Tax=Papaver somniferum TaxID=3469 RepID=UPI000E6FAF1E|nr:calmodulin-like protein 7 [Papaver somniferum]